jgi:hypothetical protein
LATANQDPAFLVLAEFILRLSLEPLLLHETKCIATQALLDTFPTDAATNAHLATFRVHCGRLMTLNLLLTSTVDNSPPLNTRRESLLNPLPPPSLSDFRS